ncbi:MAG: sigma-70 family RNA polymerase sigma factor [Deltaproteobacteria bacterium]|nr:sigma-70 family RNA polymerase sigma factor [Deltaproteobacteria bacterium]
MGIISWFCALSTVQIYFHRGGDVLFGWNKKDKSREFEELAIPVMDSLYGTALKLTRDSDSAQDLVQDAYLKAFKYFDTFETGTNFKAWMFRIMTRVFYDAYREKKRRDSMYFPIDEERPVRGYEEDETSGERKVFLGELEKIIDELPPDFKLPVILSDIHEFSYQEIADIIGCPVGTVMSRLYRGRKRLREILTESAGEINSDMGKVISLGSVK